MEGPKHTPPELVVPELDIQAQLILASGPMSSGKTAVALSYAWELEQRGCNVMAFRPEQDLRHARDQIECKAAGIEPYPAERVANLGKLATYAFTDRDVLFLDEPFMWTEPDKNGEPTEEPHKESILVVQRAIRMGAIVLVSTLDKSFKDEEFTWHAELRAIGEQTAADTHLGTFQHVQRTGVCELCPGEAPEDWQPSTCTNLYLDGEKTVTGSSVNPEEEQYTPDEVYVPCCASCRDTVPTLMAYSPRFVPVYEIQ